jgi:hypothetical protein
MMGLLHRHLEEFSQRQVELVRDAYRSTRAWELSPVGELLAGGMPEHEAAWCVVHGAYSRGCQATADLSRELFSLAIPWHREITGFEIRQLTPSHETVLVLGLCRCRPKGSWEVVEVPFLHQWRLRDGRLTAVLSQFDAVELRRVA